jgi:hypothetical protein
MEVAMTGSRRLTLALAVFAVLFLVVTGYAIGLLWALRDPLLTAIAAFAGLVCIAATAATWWIARALDDGQEQERAVHAPPPARVGVDAGRAAVPSPRVAELPPAYLAAVMKGVQANRAALKARSTPF